MTLHRICADCSQRGTVRAHRKLAYCASSLETASAVACSCASRAKAGCAFETSAGTSQLGHVPTDSGLSPVQCFSIGCRLTTASTTRCARVASSRGAPPPERERAQWRPRVRATGKPAVCWRPQLARRRVLNRRREASRCCSGVIWCMMRPVLARHGARAKYGARAW